MRPSPVATNVTTANAAYALTRLKVKGLKVIGGDVVVLTIPGETLIDVSNHPAIGRKAYLGMSIVYMSIKL